MNRLNWKPFAVLILFIGYNYIFTDIYPLGLLTTAGIYCIVTIGLCLLLGYAGQISLGHAAFFGLGGFTTAFLTTRYGWPLWATFLVSVSLVMLIAYIIGMPTLKLRGHYLAMATLGFGEIIYFLLQSNIELTGGTGGIFKVPPLIVFGYNFNADNGVDYFLLIWIIVAVLMLFADNLIRSRPGRALIAIHGNEEAANASGVNTSAFKLKIFVLSAGLAAAAGFLYAHNNRYIGVSASELMLSVIFVAMVALGGMANTWGVLLATVLLALLPDKLAKFQELNVSDLPAFLSAAGMSQEQLRKLLMKIQELDILIYGGIIILIMIFMPQGIFAGAIDLYKSLRARIRALRGKSTEQNQTS